MTQGEFTKSALPDARITVPFRLRSNGDTLCGMDRRELRTAWLEPDAVFLIDQTKPAHTGVSLSRRSKRSCGT